MTPGGRLEDSDLAAATSRRERQARQRGKRLRSGLITLVNEFAHLIRRGKRAEKPGAEYSQLPKPFEDGYDDYL